MWPDSMQCFSCRIGTLRRKDVTDGQLVDGQLILVPNVMAWQCDVCGDFAYDDEMLARVDFLLGSSMRRSGPSRPQHSRSGPGSPSADDSKQKRAR